MWYVLQAQLLARLFALRRVESKTADTEDHLQDVQRKILRKHNESRMFKRARNINHDAFNYVFIYYYYFMV